MRIITVFIGCDFKKSDCFVLGCCCNIEFLYSRKVEYLNDRNPSGIGLSCRSLSYADYERRNHRKVSVSIVAVILHFCLCF